jgi:chromosome partitioning protein
MSDIVVSGYKGGVGKTTTALHLAHFLASRTGESVLLIDCDTRNQTAIAHAATAEAANMELGFRVVGDAESRTLIRKYQHAVFDMPGSQEDTKLLDLARNADLLVLPSGINDRANIEPILKAAEELDPKLYRVLVTMAPPRPQKDGEVMQQLFDEELRNIHRARYGEIQPPVLKTLVRFAKAYNHASNRGQLVFDGAYEAVATEIFDIIGVKV